MMQELVDVTTLTTFNTLCASSYLDLDLEQVYLNAINCCKQSLPSAL